MAITRAQTAVSRYDGGYGTALSLAAAVGDVLVLLVSGSNAQTVTGVSTTGSTGATGSWTQGATVTGSNTRIDIWIGVCTSAGTISVAPTGSASDAGYSLHSYAGVDTSAPQDGTGQTAASNDVTSLTTGSVDTSVADAVCVAMYANETADKTIDWTGGTPDYTQQTNESGHVHKTSDAIVTATGSYNCGASWTGAVSSALAMIVLKGTAEGGGATRTPTVGSASFAGIAGRMGFGITVPTEVDA